MNQLWHIFVVFVLVVATLQVVVEPVRPAVSQPLRAASGVNDRLPQAVRILYSEPEYVCLLDEPTRLICDGMLRSGQVEIAVNADHVYYCAPTPLPKGCVVVPQWESW